MNNELIIKTKERLGELKEERDKTKKLLLELEELKRSDDVKRYLELCSYDTERNNELVSCSEEDLIMKSWSKYNYLNRETNKIYFCIGTYITTYTHYEDDTYTYYNDPKANYRCFMNIENEFDVRNIGVEYCDEFIKKNNVILPKNSFFANREYWILRREFFIDLIKSSQEEAVKKLLKKCEGK